MSDEAAQIVADPTEVITRVLRDHRMPQWSAVCRCGRDRLNELTHRQHVTTEVVAALGLRVETRTLLDGYAGQVDLGTSTVGNVVHVGRAATVQRRWVTPWREES